MKTKFSLKKIKDYVRHWCLHREYTHDEYDCIFVIAIKDGIIKYKDKRGNIHYDDLDKFDGDDFFVSPVDPHDEPIIAYNDLYRLEPQEDNVSRLPISSNKSNDVKIQYYKDDNGNFDYSLTSNCIYDGGF